MNSHHIIIVIHLLAATVWVGGHLILSISVLPKALRNKDPQMIRNFEERYELIGVPALLVSVVSGIMLAYVYDVPVQKWFHFEGQIERVISFKLLLLFITLGLGIHARLFLIPKLNAANLSAMGIHILAITITGVLMLILGTTVRWGGL